jgi:hypothetical protein
MSNKDGVAHGAVLTSIIMGKSIAAVERSLFWMLSNINFTTVFNQRYWIINLVVYKFKFKKE